MDKLLILRGHDPAALRARIEARSRVKEEASPRLLVVEADPASVEELEASPEIASGEAILDDPGAFASLKLTPAEELFMRAWKKRQTLEADKQRIGERLSWDHKDFEAP